MQIILGLGSNLGDREQNLRRAVALVAAGLLDDIIKSGLHKSKPLLPENAPAEWAGMEFLNMVIAGELKHPEMTPHEFLQEIKDFEVALGRQPAPHWAPRVIDIDILAWGNESIDLPGLKIPHPEMFKREFVMQPLREILPGWRQP